MKRCEIAFAQIVSLLMRSEYYRNFTLADLEWLVAPPIGLGQFSIAEAQSKEKGLTMPVGLVLWASVSPEADERLSSAETRTPRLAPQDWKSGDIVWIVEAIGDPQVLGEMLKRLREKEWAGRTAKVCAIGKDGRAHVSKIHTTS